MRYLIPGLGADKRVFRRLRLHGTRDRLLPVGAALVEYWLPGAGHFLIVSHAAQVSRLLAALAAGRAANRLAA